MGSKPDMTQKTAASPVNRVIRKPDGTVVELQKNGDTRLTRPDGTVTVYQEDGTVVHISTDGVRTESRPKSRIKPEERPLNVTSMTTERIGRLLSNFAKTPFTLDGVRYASIEAFYVCLKTDDAGLRKQIRTLSGPAARAAGKGLKPTETTYGKQWFDSEARSIMTSSNEQFERSWNKTQRSPKNSLPPIRAQSSMIPAGLNAAPLGCRPLFFAGFSLRSARNSQRNKRAGQFERKPIETRKSFSPASSRATHAAPAQGRSEPALP
jgi:hypothetical protein